MERLQEQPVAQILPDMRMPDIDGRELCRRVSQDIGPIPFILFSACIPAHHRHEIDATVDVWSSLRKPFDNQDVLSLVKEALTASACGVKSSQSQPTKKLTSKHLYICTD